VVVVDHHESHAMLAFVGAGVERALVAVIDGMGNRIGPSSGDTWWMGSFQRQSYYLASWVDDCVRLELVDEDCSGPEAVGVGEAYRAITHFLGWDSYQYAGKAMALAAFGQPHRWPDLKFFGLQAGKIVTLMENCHDHPVEQVQEILRRHSIVLSRDDLDLPPRERPVAELCDLLACFQGQVETVLVERLAGLCDRYAVPSVCVSGGVALNCLTMGRLARERPDLRIYVPPAPGDTGQGLGNALWVAFHEKSPFHEPSMALHSSGIRTAALGPEYPASHFDKAAATLSNSPDVSLSGPYKAGHLVRVVTDLIEQGVVIGVRQGRAEYGPRALGQASVLADPRYDWMPARVNAFKRREPFRPYAPSMLTERAGAYFEPAVESPFMSFASWVRPEQHARIPAVVHADESARCQTVDRDGPALLRAILEEFERRTGVPILLNTSFNRAGEPIVETPADAVRSFLDSELGALCLGPYVAVKRHVGC
jgi:carbamoyltransferase